MTPARIAVVVPCFRVRNQILDALRRIGPEVTRIYVVDDACPEQTGRLVETECSDPRVRVLFHETNAGVGGATMTGYAQAIRDRMEIVVKYDGDGQMDGRLIPDFVGPIVAGRADYAKGNRFFVLDSLETMPTMRRLGNAILSFSNKVASGYWNLMDPANGFTAIHASVLGLLPLDKIDRGYFFESDLLFRLNTVRAAVTDIPMDAIYGDEQSQLDPVRVGVTFPLKLAGRFAKRIFYSYFLRDFNVCSIELVAGSILLAFGTIFGTVEWYRSITGGVAATTGTVMLAALPVILGFQLLLAAVAYDVANVPREPLHPRLTRRERE